MCKVVYEISFEEVEWTEAYLRAEKFLQDSLYPPFMPQFIAFYFNYLSSTASSEALCLFV